MPTHQYDTEERQLEEVARNVKGTLQDHYHESRGEDIADPDHVLIAAEILRNALDTIRSTSIDPEAREIAYTLRNLPMAMTERGFSLPGFISRMDSRRRETFLLLGGAACENYR